jgi:hypothetical protein
MERLLVAVLILAPFMSAQEADGDKLVTVPRRYVSSEGLTHQAPAGVSSWVGIGKEIGEATKEGLAAVVDQAERFGTTRVGFFVMAMVAWKIIGHDILAVVLGVPIWIAGVCLWIWSMRRFFFGRSVVAKEDRAAKTKEYKVEKYAFDSGDSRNACGIFHGLFLAAWCVVWLFLIF